MVIKPMIRNNICMNAHPEGCAHYVRDEIAYVRSKGALSRGPKNALVIGSSTGYGLSSRIVLAFGYGAGTIGVAFEREGSEKRTGTAGWYNTAAFEAEAKAAGVKSSSIFGDAFSNEIKQETIARIKEMFGKVDLVVYSLASGVRTDPSDGTMYRSALKPIGEEYTSKSLDPMSGAVQQATVGPANEEEIAHTTKVMGGEDWQLWIDALMRAGVLADGCTTVAYSYIGPELTKPIYREGTIGRAKEHLEATAHNLGTRLEEELHGRAFVSVNKALVTRASAVIPVVPLYLAILFRVMKEKGIHENTIAQMHRLFSSRLYSGGEVPVDDEGRIRLDDWEMRDDVQHAIDEVWDRVDDSNVSRYADIEQYRLDFLRMHGFGFDDIDYEKDVAP